MMLASWVTRTPAIRDALGASTAAMGLLLFGASVGSMSGILSSAPLVRRFGTKAVVGCGLSVLLAGATLIGIGSASSSAPLVLAGLFCFGLGIGSAEVAINIEGAEIERLTGRPVLVEAHGCFSAGTLVGALVGIGLTAVDAPVAPGLITLAAAAIPALVWGLAGLAPGFGRKPVESAAAAGSTREAHGETGNPGKPSEPRPVWKDLRLLLIAAILLAFALGEGSATDWLPLLMVDGFDLSESSGSVVFAAFAVTMTIGRFGGRLLLIRFGRVAVLRAGSILAALGVSTVIFVDDPVVAGAAVTLWGLGISLGFPVAIGAASDSGPDSVSRVSLVATAGYVAFLVGPPLLGFLGEHFGLRSAMLVVLAGLATVVFLAPAAGARKAEPARE